MTSNPRATALARLRESARAEQLTLAWLRFQCWQDCACRQQHERAFRASITGARYRVRWRGRLADG